MPGVRSGDLVGVQSMGMLSRVRSSCTELRFQFIDIGNEAHDYTHYLAIATYPTAKYSPLVSSRLTRPSPASIQIWSFGPGIIAQQASPAKGSPSKRKKPTPKTIPSSNMADARANLSMVLCVDCGPANDTKWCPLPSHDPVCIHLS